MFSCNIFGTKNKSQTFQSKIEGLTYQMFDTNKWIDTDTISILGQKMVQDRLVLEGVSRDSKNWYYIFDLNKKKLIHTIDSPLDEHPGEIFCLHNETFICSGIWDPSNVVFIDLKNQSTVARSFDAVKPSSFSRLVQNESTLFFLGDPTGVSFSDKEALQTVKKGAPMGAGGIYGYLSRPIKNELNLLTGHFKAENLKEMSCYALNAEREIVWEYLAKNPMEGVAPELYRKTEAIQFEDVFTLHLLNDVIGLDKETGAEKWKKTMNQRILRSYFYQNKLLLLTRNAMDNEGKPLSKITLHLLNVEDGNILWNFEQMSTNSPVNVGILGDKILMSTNEFFTILDESGTVIKEEETTEKTSKEMSFDHLTDEYKNQHYIFDEDGVLYW